MIFRVIRHSAIVSGASLLGAASGFVFLAYAGRTLGPQLLGQLLLVGTLVGFFARLITVGVGLIELREIAAADDDTSNIIARFLVLRLVLSVASYAELVLFLVVADYDPEIRAFSLIMGITLFLNPWAAVGNSLLTGTRRVGLANAIGVMITLVGTAANIGVLMVDLGVRGVVLTNVVVGVVSAMLWLLMLRSELRMRAFLVGWEDMRTILNKLRPALPVMLFNAGNHAANTILLSKLPGPLLQTAAVGYFTPALSIARAPFVLLAGFRQAIVAVVARPGEKEGRQGHELETALKISSLSLALPVAVLFSFFAEPIVTFVLGATFQPSAPVLSIVGWAMALGIVVIPLEGYLLAAGRIEHLRLMPIALPPLIVNVALCLLLIPWWSHVGAAIALLGSRLIYAIFLTLGYRRHFDATPASARMRRTVIVLSAAAISGSALIANVVDAVLPRAILTAVVLIPTAGLPLLQARRALHARDKVSLHIRRA